uniref:putative B3 domain-containing protein At5g58280 n=1 Tax=Erigeron canadensis TaxID=72917 RepID=UPI001CB92522|nr:putative B3 domain-containing protein At5g58280 [Erigeron canadensis]
MGEEITSNSYEEARKRQLLENKKRFEDLGILNISKSLSALSNSDKKSKQCEAKPKLRNAPVTEPRRSTRTRNPIVTYQDEVNVRFSTVRRRSKFKSLAESYLVRPVEEVRLASYEDRVQAMESAEKLRINLQSEHPSFVLSMDRSHVYNCFWLGLPETFCNTHLPKSTVRMLLENEDGNEYECVFIGQRAGLSSGWRAFALEHKLEDGDALVFELIEQKRFKVYIVKLSDGGSQDDDIMSNVDKEAIETKKKTTKPAKKLKKTPGNRKELTKPIAKKSAQSKRPNKSVEVVTGTRRSTRI